MWLFTVHGFFSVVESHNDPDTLLVRARLKAHLVQLKSAHPSIGSSKIQESPERDYRWRLIVARSDWERTAAELTVDIDYDNFKSAASSEHPDDTAYLDALHQVWATMEALTRARERAPFRFSPITSNLSVSYVRPVAPLPKVYQRRMEDLYARTIAAEAEETAKTENPRKNRRKSKRRKSK